MHNVIFTAFDMYVLRRPQELDVAFSILVYPLGTTGKDGHSAAAQIVFG